MTSEQNIYTLKQKKEVNNLIVYLSEQNGNSVYEKILSLIILI